MKPRRISIWDWRILTLLVLSFAVLLAYSGTLLMPVKAVESGIRVSFVLAFLGGFFALLSPCSAVVLPAFFTYSFQGRKELFKMTYVFFLGLLTIFIPLGFSTSVISFLFSFFRDITFLVSGIMLAAIGLVKIFGIRLGFLGHGFFMRGFPEKRDNMTAYVFLTGMLFSFTTIACTGPIIGGIATMASAFGFSSVLSILLLTVFALGLVAPLFLLSLLFSRYDFSKSWVIREASVRVMGKEFRFLPVNLVSGSVFLVLGVTFIFYQKLSSLFSLGNSGVSTIYLQATTMLVEYLNDNPALNTLLSLLLVAVIGWAVWRVARKEKAA